MRYRQILASFLLHSSFLSAHPTHTSHKEVVDSSLAPKTLQVDCTTPGAVVIGSTGLKHAEDNVSVMNKHIGAPLGDFDKGKQAGKPSSKLHDPSSKQSSATTAKGSTPNDRKDSLQNSSTIKPVSNYPASVTPASKMIPTDSPLPPESPVSPLPLEHTSPAASPPPAAKLPTAIPGPPSPKITAPVPPPSMPPVIPPPEGLPSAAHGLPVLPNDLQTEIANHAGTSRHLPEVSSSSDPMFPLIMLEVHNQLRAHHGVPALQHNATLAQYAQALSEKCVYKHSDGPYGENMGLGSTGVTSLLNYMYTDEAPKYDYDAGVYTEENGHFTQMVWRTTVSVGCGFHKCDQLGGDLLFCDYYPPGNYEGEFKENVPKPISTFPPAS